MDIMMFIPKGRENAISRQTLVGVLGLPDRTVRNLIEEARRRGEIILNDGSGVGYWTSDDIGELKRQYKMNQNRAMSVLVQQKYLRRRIKELETPSVTATGGDSSPVKGAPERKGGATWRTSFVNCVGGT